MTNKTMTLEQVRDVLRHYAMGEFLPPSRGDATRWADAIDAHLARQSEWPSEGDVDAIGVALYIYWNDVNEQARNAYRKKIRAALQSVRPPATNSNEVSSKVVDAESVRPPAGVVSDEDVKIGVVAFNKAFDDTPIDADDYDTRTVRAVIESYASRHAPTKD